MRWLVDGMNVIGSRPDGWWKDRHRAMVRLVGLLERCAATGVAEITVIFDGPPSPPISSEAIEVAHASHSGPDAADDEIVQRVLADSRPDEIRVVTSDRGLADRVRAAGASVEPAGPFRRRLEAVLEPGCSSR